VRARTWQFLCMKELSDPSVEDNGEEQPMTVINDAPLKNRARKNPATETAELL